jgi:hypothetical protein
MKKITGLAAQDLINEEECQQCLIDLDEAAVTYTDCDEVMMALVAYLVAHGNKCEVAPSGNGTFAYMIRTIND